MPCSPVHKNHSSEQQDTQELHIPPNHWHLPNKVNNVLLQKIIFLINKIVLHSAFSILCDFTPFFLWSQLNAHNNNAAWILHFPGFYAILSSAHKNIESVLCHVHLQGHLSLVVIYN